MKSMKNDLRYLKYFSILALFPAVLALIIPFLVPGERLWPAVFLISMFASSIGSARHRVISSLQKRVLELESRHTHTEPQDAD